MKIRILSVFMAILMVISAVSITSATTTEDIFVEFSWRHITDEQLAEMISDGTIPKNVTHLRLHSNQITDLTPLAGLTSLEWLYLEDNQITDLTPLNGLTNLRVLYLNNTPITNITPLAGLTSLEWLYLEDNQITNLTPLNGLTNLRVLYLNNNPITNITPLAGLMSLEWLTLRDTQISDLTPLKGLNNLGQVVMSRNSLDEVHLKVLKRVIPNCYIYFPVINLCDCRLCVVCTAVPLPMPPFTYSIASGNPTITDALEILMFLAELPSDIDIAGGRNPIIDDAIEILIYLAGLPNVFDGVGQ
jgi:Leucine-rich repeat (LRR) protein